MADSNPARQYDAFVMLDTMIEMQKRVVSSLDRTATRISELTSESDRHARMNIQTREDIGTLRSDIGTLRSDMRTEFGEIRGEITGLRQDVGGLRVDMLSRFEAVGARFDENDRAHERMEQAIQNALSDIVSQNNDTLNAVQSALQVRMQFVEMIARIEALERKGG
jgi:hypothetical protein